MPYYLVPNFDFYLFFMAGILHSFKLVVAWKIFHFIPWNRLSMIILTVKRLIWQCTRNSCFGRHLNFSFWLVCALTSIFTLFDEPIALGRTRASAPKKTRAGKKNGGANATLCPHLSSRRDRLARIRTTKLPGSLRHRLEGRSAGGGSRPDRGRGEGVAGATGEARRGSRRDRGSAGAELRKVRGAVGVARETKIESG